MVGLQSRLFIRIISRNREVYLLKIITLAFAFASAVLIILFSLNEFGYDECYDNPNAVFRVVQKDTDKEHRGNRLSVKIPTEVFDHLKKGYKDSLLVSRVKIMNQVTVLSNGKSFADQKVHAADETISSIFSLVITNGDVGGFNTANGVSALLSERAARKYTGTLQAVGKRIKLYTFSDTIEVKVVAVFKDFPKNSHEDFDVFLTFNSEALTALNFGPNDTGVYGRVVRSNPEHYKFFATDKSTMSYSLQPLPQLYFGPRMLGEDARHGDSYSVIILICITSLILFLALTSFVNLTTITLPHRSKELAVKKLAGTNHANLLFAFLRESFMLVGISFLTGMLILVASSGLIESTLNFPVWPLILQVNIRLILMVAILFVILTVSPVVVTIRFVRATPSRLLGADTITFPRLKRMVTFLQLGISIFLIIASVVVHRQINYSLVKEPGQNHDQIVYFRAPSGMGNEDIVALRSNWRNDNPNILDIMAVSQLPNLIRSKEIGSEFYLLQVDRGFRDFFGLTMEDGKWFGPNAGDSTTVVNRNAEHRLGKNQANVIGVVEDVSGQFNQPEKPLKIKLAWDYYYNWLCVRALEVDIRHTVNQISNQFSFKGTPARVNYLNKNFKSWIDYQDRLNLLSQILSILSGLLSCCAIYGLSISLVRDKLKQIAVHKLLGAHTIDITYLLAMEFVKQMAIAIAVFGPLTFIILNELLRTFVFATKFSWLDPVYPIAYCVFVIVAICGFQARSLNRTDFASALKG